MSGYSVPWTAAEDDTIRRYAGYLEVEKMVEHLPGRTAVATRQRAVNALRISLRLGVRQEGAPPIALDRGQQPALEAIPTTRSPAPDELLSEEAARLLVGLAKARKRSPRSLVTALMEIMVREPTLLDNILDEG